MEETILELMYSFITSKFPLLIVSILMVIFAVKDIKANYSKVGPAGKSSKIGLFILGLSFFIISIVNFIKYN